MDPLCYLTWEATMKDYVRSTLTLTRPTPFHCRSQSVCLKWVVISYPRLFTISYHALANTSRLSNPGTGCSQPLVLQLGCSVLFTTLYHALTVHTTKQPQKSAQCGYGPVPSCDWSLSPVYSSADWYKSPHRPLLILLDSKEMWPVCGTCYTCYLNGLNLLYMLFKWPLLPFWLLLPFSKPKYSIIRHFAGYRHYRENCPGPQSPTIF
jgi:hypothetical protein